MQQLLGRGRDGQVVRSDLDVGHRVHQHGDVFLGGHGLRGPDVHLRQAHVQLVDALYGGDPESRAAADDPVAEFLRGHRSVGIADLVVPPDQAGDDQRRVRRGDFVARDEFDQDDQARDAGQDPVPVGLEELQDIFHRVSLLSVVCPGPAPRFGVCLQL